MAKVHKKSCDLISCGSTESEDRDEELLNCKTNPRKHKTELCKNYSEQGRCPYGNKCRFAHGTHELVNLPLQRPERKSKCNGFWKKGCCSYGIRCRFGHQEASLEQSSILLGMEQVLSGDCFYRPSRLLHLLQSSF